MTKLALGEPLDHNWAGVRPIRTHSMVLIVAGLVYVAIGISYLTAEPTPERLRALKFALVWLDYNHWGYVWVLVGILSIISSRWPPVSETWGYTVLTGQAAAWGLFYGTGIAFGSAPNSNVSGVLSWGLIAFMWWSISRLVNPEVQALLLSRIHGLQAENLVLQDQVRRLQHEDQLRREDRG